MEKLCQLNFHITKPDLIPFALLPPFFVVGLKEVAFLTATFYYKFNRTQIYADHRRNKKRRYAHSAKRLSVYIRVQKGISYTIKLSVMESKKNIIPFSRRISQQVFYGWWIVLLGSLILAVGAGILSQAFTVFFLPLKRDLAVSSAAISLLYGAARLEGGAEGPLVGYLIDRFGPRVVIIAGATLSGIGLILLSLVHSFFSFFFIYIFIISLGFNAGFFHPVYAVVNSWFIRNRGLGFSLTGAATNIGGMIMAPLLSYWILNFGWRTGAVLSGLIILIVVLPAAIPIHRTPEVMGLHPDGRPPQKSPANDSKLGRDAGAEMNFTVGEALRTLNYWLLFFSITLRVLVTVALTIHFVPILVWQGMSEAASAYLISLFAFFAIITTLVSGWIGDRWNKSLLCSVGIIATVLGMLALMLSQSPAALYALPIGLAITMGTVPQNWALIGDFFGRRSYATLRGIVGIGTGLGTFLSPIYAGWIFDHSGSYYYVLLTFIVIHLGASSLFAILYHRSPQKGLLDL